MKFSQESKESRPDPYRKTKLGIYGYKKNHRKKGQEQALKREEKKSFILEARKIF